jgi:multidrug efflux system membrane fusion protein
MSVSLRSRRLRPGMILAAVAAVAVLITAAAALAQTPSSSPAVPVTVSTAARRDVPIWLHGLGTVQANYAAQLRSRVDGTLIEVPVKEGQEVKKGDLVAVIDPRPFKAALDAAIAKKQQDQAQLSNAQSDLGRYATLAKQDFASRQQLETQQALVKQYYASILGDDAQVETAQLNLSFCYITTMFDGRVGMRNLDPGNMVHAAEVTPIISVTQIQPISVMFTLPQETLPSIMRAMEQHKLDAVVFAPDDKTELDHGTIRLKATFPNEHRTLWPGQFVNVRLLLGMDTNVMAVAAPAVQHGPNGLYVYQVGQNDTVAVQPIKVARQEGDIYIIASGLADGAVVVETGQSRLQAGAHVSVRQAQAGPGSAARSGG